MLENIISHKYIKKNKTTIKDSKTEWCKALVDDKSYTTTVQNMQPGLKKKKDLVNKLFENVTTFQELPFI